MQAKTSFNIRLNNDRKEVKKNNNSIITSKHFQQKSRNFYKHAKFNIIDQLMNTSKSKETFTQQLIKRENVQILNRYAIPKKVPKRNFVNNTDNKYNERLLNCISLSKIRFAMLQLGNPVQCKENNFLRQIQ